MDITAEKLKEILELDIESKVVIMQHIADELMTVKQYHEITKIPERTIYDKIGSADIKVFILKGLRLLHF